MRLTKVVRQGFLHLGDARDVGVLGADEGNEAFPGLLPKDTQAPVLMNSLGQSFILAKFFVNSWQVIVQPEVSQYSILDAWGCVHAALDCQPVIRAFQRDKLTADEAAPHTVGHMPAKGLAALKSKRQVQGLVYSNFHSSDV
jgi:hypothetical protein